MLVNAALQTDIDAVWREKVEHLSRLCEEGAPKTHIAFLGTSMLARAVEPAADLIYIKPTKAPDNPNAYSARPLCEGVLVPVSAKLNFDLGVTGRQPLNNQPYFRMSYLGDDTPIHAGGREAFDYMFGLVRELNAGTPHEAADALAAFIAVRRAYIPDYSKFESNAITASELIAAATAFVAENSEGGKRAQAVAAGFIDVFAGAENVLSGRINDPSRKFPGDVCVTSTTGDWEKSFEVRDKPVTSSDVLVFARKCAALQVREAAIIMASQTQTSIHLDRWAEKQGIGLTLFFGWEELASQCFFWSEKPTPEAAQDASFRIFERLVEVEAHPDSVARWNALTSITV